MVKMTKAENDTKIIREIYEFFCTKQKNVCSVSKWHFDKMQETVSEPIVRGNVGIDIGSGIGYDTYIMAKNNPSVKITSVDIGKGVFITKKIASDLQNVEIIQGSVLDMPFKDNMFDFAYSFGVIHHTIAPKKALSEISRILKRNSPAFLYLYENHSENPIKYIASKVISSLKVITIKIPPQILYGLSWLLSPFVYILFSIPSKILKNFNSTQGLSNKIPFNFGSGIFSLRADICETLAVPIEFRFARHEVYDMFIECGFSKINITRMKDTAGWVVWGYKV